ncbi:MAG TPA: biotin/lipoyl-containing protein [Streptosporangiaceae bacterium]|nr:biotin/lipoyl-containing protein [Streptosporangiaceae bacterium]
MDVNPLTNDDVADILALLDSLPYDELDLETPRFRLTLRRTPAGWTQSTQVHAAPASAAHGVKGPPPPSIGGKGPFTPVDEGGNGGEGPFTPVDEGRGGEADEVGGIAEGEGDGEGDGDGEEEGEEGRGLVVVRAPLPGTFYRAPRPGAAPFVEVGSQVGADTVIGIVETMKLMNSVPAGVAGVVAEFCVANAEFAAQGAALLRIRADR